MISFAANLTAKLYKGGSGQGGSEENCIWGLTV